MKRILLVLALLCFSSTALARPGFSLGFGFGPTSVGGQDVPYEHLQPDANNIRLTGGVPLTTEIDGGISGSFHMGFNILGYAALETRLTGHGHDINDAKIRSWAAHWHTGVRAYPMWHWQKLLPPYLHPLEPSIFIGWGSSYQGYAPTTLDEVAWSKWGSWRYGLGLEYFLVSYFKVGLEYSYVRAAYNNFIYDLEDSINFPVDPPATTGYHQLYLLAIFQFNPAEEPVRY